MISTACPVCQTVFESYPSQRRTYCSRACKEKVQSEARKGLPLSPNFRRPKRGQMVACPVCGKEVYRRTSQLDVRFCSYTCANVWQGRNRVTLTCPICGKEFQRSPSVAAIQTYCSKRCAGDAVKRPAGRMHNDRPVRLDNQGYVLIWEPEHPNQSQHGWQYEHRLIAEAVLGRRLASNDHVHHRNGIKHDNRPENLQVMDAVEHAALSSQDYWRGIRDAALTRPAPLDEE